MTSQLPIFAGPEDDRALREYAKSIGLTLLHPYAKRMTPEENEKSFEQPNQGGDFSFLPVNRLHTHPLHHTLCDVLDPLIMYIRPHYVPPYLVAGQVRLTTDAEECAKLAKPYFEKIRRWVRKNWKYREEDKFYIGPDAEAILRREHPQIAYFPPDVTIIYKIIPQGPVRQRKGRRRTNS